MIDPYLEIFKREPTPEETEKFKVWWAKFSKDYDKYMNQEDHEGNCHCARCMQEFLK